MNIFYDKLLVEIRPQLQCCNVFIQLLNTYDNSFKVDLTETEFVISKNDIFDQISLRNICSIKPDSLSGLTIKNEIVTFRFLTQPLKKSRGGSFEVELLAETTKCHPGYQHENPDCPYLKIEQELVSTITPYNIQCQGCKSCLVTKTPNPLNRILNLEVLQFDLNDLFCHLPESGCSQDLLKFQNNRDIFKDNVSLYLPDDLISGDANPVVCTTCSSWLGLKRRVHQRTFSNLFFDSILINDEIPFSGVKDPIVYFLKLMSDDFKGGGLKKVIYRCQETGGCNKYLAVWCMDASLNVFYKGDKLSDLERVKKCICNGIRDVDNHLYYLAKVLFRFESVLSDQLEGWLQGDRVKIIDISKSMINSALDYLNEMRNVLPFHSMAVTDNGFDISYIFL